MAKIEELHFEIKLDGEKEFRRSIEDIKDLANKFNKDVSELLNIQQRIAKAKGQSALAEQKLATETEKTALAHQKTNTEFLRGVKLSKQIDAQMNSILGKAKDLSKMTLFRDVQSHDRKVDKRNFMGYIEGLTEENSILKEMSEYYKEIEKSQEKTENSLERTSQSGQRLYSFIATYLSYNTIKGFVSELVSVTAEFEKQRIALGAILNDVSSANLLFDQLQELAVKSPFQFSELTSYAKQLSAYSIPVEELYETTKMLADVSAGLGVDMQRIILAYGQIRSASFLRGQEVRQLTEAGIPILQMLAKQFEELEGRAVSVGEVFKRISSREVPFAMVEQAFRDMTSEGGKFYNMQEKLAESVSGRISNLKDAWQVMLNKIGEGNNVIIKGFIDGLYGLISAHKVLIPLVGGLASALGSLGLAAILTSNAVKGFFALFATGKGAVAIAIGALTAIAGVISVLNENTENYLDSVDKKAKETTSSIGTEVSKLDSLVKTLKQAEAGSDAYNNAKRNLLDTYKEYLPSLSEEDLEIKKLTQTYNTLKEAIVSVQKEKALTDIKSELNTNYQKNTADVFKSFESILKGFQIPTAISQELRSWMYGEVGTESLTSATKKWIEKIDESRGYRENAEGFGGIYELTLTDLYNRVQKEVKSLTDGLEKADRMFAPKIEEGDFGFIRLINNVATKNGFSNLKWSEDISIDEYIDNLRKSFKEAQDLVEQQQQALSTSSKQLSAEETSVEQNLLNTYKKRSETIQEIASLLGVNLFEERKSKVRQSTTDPVVDALIYELNALRKLAEAYKELEEEGLSSENINNVLKQFFPNESKYISGVNDYASRIDDVAGRLKRYSQLGDKRATDFLLSYDQKKFADFLSDLRKANNETEKLDKKFDEALGKWDEGLLSEGSSYRISKILKDYNDKIADISKRAKEMQDLFNQKGIGEGDSRFQKFVEGQETQEINAEAKALAELTKETEKLFETYMKQDSRYMAITEGNRATRNKYTRAIRKEWMAMFNEDGSLSQSGMNNPLLSSIEANINSGTNGALKSFWNEWKKNQRKINNDGLSGLNGFFGQILPKWADQSGYDKFKTLSDGISAISNSLLEYAEVTNNAGLKDGMEAVAGVLQATTDIAQGFMQGGIVGGAIAAAKIVIETIMTELTYAAQLESAIHDARIEAKKNEWSDLLNEDSIFGDNFLSNMDNIRKVLRESKDAYDSLIRDIENLRPRTDVTSGIGGSILGSLLPGFELFGIGLGVSNATKEARTYFDALNKGYTDLEAHTLRINDRSGFVNFFGWGDEFMSLKDAIESLGYEMYDEYGILNTEGLQAVMDTYKRLSSADKEWMEDAIKYSESYREAMEALDGTLSELYGNVASQVADKMLDMWKQSGDAAIEYSDILNDVAEQYAKMSIESVILGEVFNDEFKEKMRNLTLNKDVQGSMNLFADKMAEIEGYVPYINELLYSLSDWIQPSGVNDMSESIKSITETQADLLASYINAIRADVSTTKGVIQGTSNDVKAILGLLPNTPTLSEYLNEIQANTYNIQVTTENILSELRGVIGLESGATAIRVSM